MKKTRRGAEEEACIEKTKKRNREKNSRQSLSIRPNCSIKLDEKSTSFFKDQTSLLFLLFQYSLYNPLKSCIEQIFRSSSLRTAQFAFALKRPLLRLESFAAKAKPFEHSLNFKRPFLRSNTLRSPTI